LKNLDNIRNIYFLGIGGIGMSALARYFLLSGKKVAGYDRTETPLTKQLETEGIPIHYFDNINLIDPDFLTPENTAVIYTPALPKDHSEFNHFSKKGFPVYKRSQVLGLISRNYKTIAVAGTHGKTTVSTMIAHIMWESSEGCNAFLGGISKNFRSNLAANPSSSWVVTEADEFDRSFLQLYPFASVITAMDPDHLDIYGTAEVMNEAFFRYASQIDRNGIALIKSGLPLSVNVLPKHTVSYSLQEGGDFYAKNIHLEGTRYHFDLIGPNITIEDISLEHPGLVNVENAVAASAMTWLLGIDPLHIRKSLYGFSGIERRFDYKIKSDSIIYIDDYAHHPGEIEATLKSVRDMHPGKKITGVFQPHLFSRTRDLADGFAESLSLLDRLILLDIYPARELPIEGVTSELIFRNVKINDKIMCHKEQLTEIIDSLDLEILITLGAGDIDKLVNPIMKQLQRKAKA
jgi:UDP-N-acetylmuramate--alanine ligase